VRRHAELEDKAEWGGCELRAGSGDECRGPQVCGWVVVGREEGLALGSVAL
jgi:hypothetical protein